MNVLSSCLAWMDSNGVSDRLLSVVVLTLAAASPMLLDLDTNNVEPHKL